MELCSARKMLIVIGQIPYGVPSKGRIEPQASNGASDIYSDSKSGT